MTLRRSPLRAKSKPYKPVAVRLHHERVAALPCLVSGRYGVTLHHVTGYADRPGRFTRDDWLVVPLAPEYHLIQFGPKWSVEALGHQGFFKEWGIDLLAEAMRLAEETQGKAA